MFDGLKEKLEGCFYTIFTPFNSDESIDYESLKKYIVLLYRQGGRRFYVMAYNSRYSQLTNSEILELNEFCIRVVKDLDKNNIIIVGDPIHCSTKESGEFAQHAKDCGADLISLIVREKYFSDDQILDHYAEIARGTKFPILVHEMPFLSGKDGSQMNWPKSLLGSLPRIPQIIALKEDAKDFEVTRYALTLEPQIRIIIAGMKSALMPYKKYGARAYLNGISIIDARIGELFWKAYKEDDEKTIEFIINELELPFFKICAGKYGWHRTNKALLQAAGLMHRRDRMPLKHLSDEEFILVKTTYAQISAAWGTREESKS